jgi:uncharacterized protein YigA (DUF484 family)
MLNRKSLNKKSESSTTLKVIAVLALQGAAQAAKLRFCNPAENVNYIFNSSSSYDMPMSKRIAQALMNGECGLSPGKMPGNFKHCEELFDLGSSVSSDKVGSTAIQMLACRQSPPENLSESDMCLAKLGNTEFNHYMDDFQTYLLIGLALLTAGATFFWLLSKCFNWTNYLPCRAADTNTAPQIKK